MSAQRRKEAESRHYHVIARGVNHCEIYADQGDRIHFMALLQDLSGEQSVSVIAWCLMSNHYHLLVHGELGSLSAMMQKLNASYALYFNTKHERDGHLFQGRFKSVPVESDGQLLTVVRYIHQNPERAGICRTADYPWSSYRNYTHGVGFASTALVLAMLGDVEGFESFHANVPRESDDDNDSEEFDEIRACARKALHGVDPVIVRRLHGEERDNAIRSLKAVHLTTRQIERLTGISRSTVSRIK